MNHESRVLIKYKLDMKPPRINLESSENVMLSIKIVNVIIYINVRNQIDMHMTAHA